MRQRIRLTESDLHRIIRESVNRILNEEWTAGYTGWNGNYGETSYVDSGEARMRNLFQRGKNQGVIGYDYFEDWKNAGYPGRNRIR